MARDMNENPWILVSLSFFPPHPPKYDNKNKKSVSFAWREGLGSGVMIGLKLKNTSAVFVEVAEGMLDFDYCLLEP